ncbi:MAG: hypothetical protein ACOZNI_20420 [Myxococcota bacterium]
MLALTLLSACSNINEREFFPDGGARASVPVDTGGGTDTGSDTGTTSGEGVPEITDSSCYFDNSEAGDVIVCDIYFYDGAADDLVGGSVYFDLIEGNGSPDTRSLDIVTESNANDPNTRAAHKGTYIQFQVVGVDTANTYVVDRIQLQDASGHTSDPATQEVSG